MKIVKVHGGLGNQMFQYAFALSLASASGDRVFIDSSAYGIEAAHNGYELSRIFDTSLGEAPEGAVRRLAVLPSGLIARLRRKYLRKTTHFIDRSFGYQPELLDRDGDIYYEGYWQSEKYFVGIADEIRREFSFKRPLAERNEELLRSLAKPVASVHVRRGDYLKYENLNILTPGYYERAISELVEGRGVGSFLVLSDDIAYCRESLRLRGVPAVFVDWNQGAESWQDMAMMARCDFNIIANSSFSWWGAWLNSSPEKIIVAPAIWNKRQLRDRDRYYRYTFGDIVPEHWRRAAP